jgi:hypothetical protein
VGRDAWSDSSFQWGAQSRCVEDGVKYSFIAMIHFQLDSLSLSKCVALPEHMGNTATEQFWRTAVRCARSQEISQRVAAAKYEFSTRGPPRFFLWSAESFITLCCATWWKLLPDIRKHLFLISSVFGNTCLCEQLFSLINLRTFDHANRNKKN